MQKEIVNWRKRATYAIELFLIILFLCYLGISGFATAILFFLSSKDGQFNNWKDDILTHLFASSFIGNVLQLMVLAFVSDEKTWNDPLQPIIQRLVNWCYYLGVFFFVLSRIALLILIKGDFKYFWPGTLLVGGADPLYIYCAQFLFPPRPRLRFISSLLVIPVCVLWIGLLLLLAFKWLGS